MRKSQDDRNFWTNNKRPSASKAYTTNNLNHLITVLELEGIYIMDRVQPFLSGIFVEKHLKILSTLQQLLSIDKLNVFSCC